MKEEYWAVMYREINEPDWGIAHDMLFDATVVPILCYSEGDATEHMESLCKSITGCEFKVQKVSVEVLE